MTVKLKEEIRKSNEKKQYGGGKKRNDIKVRSNQKYERVMKKNTEVERKETIRR